MSEDKNNDIIIFLDDDDSKKNISVEIVEISLNHVTFKTSNNNLITIPLSRVLKIKRKENEGTN